MVGELSTWNVQLNIAAFLGLYGQGKSGPMTAHLPRMRKCQGEKELVEWSFQLPLLQMKRMRSRGFRPFFQDHRARSWQGPSSSLGTGVSDVWEGRGFGYCPEWKAHRWILWQVISFYIGDLTPHLIPFPWGFLSSGHSFVLFSVRRIHCSAGVPECKKVSISSEQERLKMHPVYPCGFKNNSGIKKMIFAWNALRWGSSYRK